MERTEMGMIMESQKCKKNTCRGNWSNRPENTDGTHYNQQLVLDLQFNYETRYVRDIQMVHITDFLKLQPFIIENTITNLLYKNCYEFTQ